MHARILALVLLTAPLLAMGPCDKKGTATARCGAVENFESRLGTVNVPQLALGQFFSVNRVKKRGLPLGIVTFTPGDITTHPRVKKLATTYSSSMAITFSANVPEAARGALSTAVSKSTELAADDVERRTLTRILSLLNSDTKAKAAIATHLQNNPGDEIHVVHAVQDASRLSIGLGGGSNTEVNVSVVNYGDFELKVTYDCKNALDLAGSDVPVFFKSAPVGYDAASKEFYFESSTEPSLFEIDLTPVF